MNPDKDITREPTTTETEVIEQALDALYALWEAVPEDSNDADWWPDELRRAMERAEEVLAENGEL